jgi:hypothetical protein
MIELLDARPDIDVLPAEYHRLLGYPPGIELQDRALELSRWARDWYGANGQPWLYAHQIDRVRVDHLGVELEGLRFTAGRLRTLLQDGEAESVVLVAASAGPETEQHAQALWDDGRPDEYFFLEVYGSAVVEHLIMQAGAQLCAWADVGRMAVLPHDSPGYPGWDVAEQPRLLELMNATRGAAGPIAVEAFETGMLRPKKSLLAVFGLTAHVDRVRRLTDLVPCEQCAFERCQFRRTPYRRWGNDTSMESPALGGAAPAQAAPEAGPLDLDARYTVNAKALRRWAAERLALERRDDGTVRAVFRYDGTTCTNMGRPLAFRYEVELGPREAGYRIRGQRCAPAPGDAGYTHMCRYLSHGETLMRAIEDEAPLTGRRLNDVLGWTRAQASAGCYCDADSRTHKWGLVFETIHYALAHEEPARVARSSQGART